MDVLLASIANACWKGGEMIVQEHCSVLAGGWV